MTDSSPTPSDTPKKPPETSTSDPAEVDGRKTPLTDMPGGDGASLETAEEAELWTGRTHWKHFAGRLTLWVTGNIAVAVLLIWGVSAWEPLTGQVAFWAILVVFLVSGLMVVGRVLLTVLGHRYRLTTQRLFIQRGILSQTVDQTELIRIDDVRMHKSLLNRLFGLGTVAVASTDSSDSEIVLAGIAEPEKVAEAIRTRMRAMRRKSLFVENL